MLSENSFHLAVTVLMGLVNLLPLFIGVDSQVENSIYASTLSAPSYRGINYFLIGILAPLIVDTTLDIFQLLLKRFYSSAGDSSGNNRDPTKLSFVGSTLNTGEIIVFIIGMLIVPVVVLLPIGYTPHSTLVAICCWKVSINLLGGAYLSSLTRYFNGRKRVIMSCVTIAIVVVLAIGGIVSTLALNVDGTDINNKLFPIGLAFLYIPAALAFVSSVYWLAVEAYNLEVISMLCRIRGGAMNHDQPETSHNTNAMNGKKDDSDFEKYNVRFFRTVHIITFMVYLILWAALSSSAKSIKNATEFQAISLTVPMIIWTLSILVRTMRQVQLAAFENLVSNCTGDIKTKMCFSVDLPACEHPT